MGDQSNGGWGLKEIVELEALYYQKQFRNQEKDATGSVLNFTRLKMTLYSLISGHFESAFEINILRPL